MPITIGEWLLSGLAWEVSIGKVRGLSEWTHVDGIRGQMASEEHQRMTLTLFPPSSSSVILSLLVCTFSRPPRPPGFSLAHYLSWSHSPDVSVRHLFHHHTLFHSKKQRLWTCKKTATFFFFFFYYVESRELICPFTSTQWSLKTFVLMLLFSIFKLLWTHFHYKLCY